MVTRKLSMVCYFLSLNIGLWSQAVDKDNRKVKVAVVQIGAQFWMSKNLAVSFFSNGDPIPEARTDEDWNMAGVNHKPAWCYYGNKKVNGRKYGKLYNWYAVQDSRGLAPKGWHIPSDSEWDILVESIKGDSSAGVFLKSKFGWRNSGNGLNSVGFRALPAGNRNNNGFFNMSMLSGWWSSTDSDSLNAWYRGLYYTNNEIEKNLQSKPFGFSVRCVKD
jgi:uncharacterized protein (TIGR02145 family)